MNRRNLKEYQIIKQELNEIKNCITKYVAILFGESGISFFLTIYIKEKEFSDNSFPLILFLLFSIALTLSIFYVLIYKFKSHNRYAGYLKLINQESDLIAIEGKTESFSIITWELVMSKLINSPDSKNYPKERFSKLKFRGIKESELIEMWTLLHSPKKKIDKYAFFKGLIIILDQLTLLGTFKKVFFKKMFERPKAWGYPVSIANVVYVFTLFFLGLGVYIWAGSSEIYNLSQLLIIILFSFPILLMIYRSFRDIHKLVYGSKTIESYCWQLLFPRVEILNQFNCIPTYIPTFIDTKIVQKKGSRK